MEHYDNDLEHWESTVEHCDNKVQPFDIMVQHCETTVSAVTAQWSTVTPH